jgi:hypothetical protein
LAQRRGDLALGPGGDLAHCPPTFAPVGAGASASGWCRR